MLRIDQTKRLIVTVLAALALSTAIVASSKSASAATRQIAKSGAWSAYAGTSNTNTPLCGMLIEGGGKSLHVKYAQGWNFINIVSWKKGWSIPNDTKMSVTLGFDKVEFGDATATGYRSPPEMRADLGDYISFQVGADLIDGFLEGFQSSNKMWLRFNSGTETMWLADMTGSREIGSVFARCMKALLLPSGTQPYGKQPETSQPYAPTQPHNAPSVSQPTQPFERKPVIAPQAGERGA